MSRTVTSDPRVAAGSPVGGCPSCESTTSATPPPGWALKTGETFPGGRARLGDNTPAAALRSAS